MQTLDLKAGERDVNEPLLDNVELDCCALGHNLQQVNHQLNVDSGASGDLDRVGLDVESLEGEGLAGAGAESVLKGFDVTGGGSGEAGGGEANSHDKEDELHVDAADGEVGDDELRVEYTG